MRKIFNKYIIILVCFYAIWLLGIPYIFTKTLPFVCQKVSEKADYEIVITSPELKLSVLPIAVLKAEELKVKDKTSNDFTLIHNPYAKIRLLPLLSGRVHINKIQADDIIINALLKKDMELDKNFFKNLKKVKVKCDEIKLNRFMITLWQKNIKTPVIYTGKDIFYKRNGRYVEINFVSKVDINNSISTAEANLFLPSNNDVIKSIIFQKKI